MGPYWEERLELYLRNRITVVIHKKGTPQLKLSCFFKKPVRESPAARGGTTDDAPSSGQTKRSCAEQLELRQPAKSRQLTLFPKATSVTVPASLEASEAGQSSGNSRLSHDS